MSNTPKTKLVRINLSALPRVVYSEVVEVPASFGEEDLNELIDARYEAVDSGEFVDDTGYWERGSCSSESACQGDEASLVVTRTSSGELAFKEVASCV